MSIEGYPWALLCLVSLAALLVVERTGPRILLWTLKPLASFGFVGFALSRGALETGPDQAVFVALLLSTAGDILLMPKERPLAFLLGIGAFLLGHIGFAVAFLLWGVSWPLTAASAAALSILAVVIGRWLLPNVGPKLKGAVIAYIIVITAMVALAFGALGSGASAVLPVAACAFFVSDLSVARERFITSSTWNRLWGLPLYYIAQLLFGTLVGP